ncbi:hypothetical protein [Pseudofrankia asymbiotica]|nr:hypothetical protein [Pseudofrankia asymbiotica]
MATLARDPYRSWRRGMFWTTFAVGVTLSAALLLALIIGAISVAVQLAH